jgi:hypothetical protein
MLPDAAHSGTNRIEASHSTVDIPDFFANHAVPGIASGAPALGASEAGSAVNARSGVMSNFS